MASIIDSLEETLQDVNSVPTLIVYTLPLFYTVMIMIGEVSSPFFPIIYVFTIILNFGFMLKCTYNQRKGMPKLLPNFNIIEVLYTGLKGIIALLPLSIISGIIMGVSTSLLGNFISPDTTMFKIFYWLINAICVSFATTGYLLYAKNFKILDAYNVKYIFNYCADIMIATFFMGIKLFIINLIILAPITYIIWILFGLPNPIATFFWCLVSVLNLAMIAHYYAQIDYEIIAFNEDEIIEKEAKIAKKK